MSEQERLQKYLSRCGVCSRRRAEVLMKEGRVQVNGEVVTAMGTKIVAGRDRVAVDGEEIEADDPRVYIAMFKPPGVMTTLADEHERRTVKDLLPRGTPRCWPVGRLDWDSEGLILMTNDGTLTHALTHPGSGVEKTYHVKLRGKIDHPDRGLEKMRQPLVLDDGFKTSGADVWIASTTDNHTWVEVVLHQGHNRQIRRMAEAVGHDVLRLKRVSIGPLETGGLKPRDTRHLDRTEVLALYDAAGETPDRGARSYEPPRATARTPKSTPRSRKRGKERQQLDEKNEAKAGQRSNRSRKRSSDRKKSRGSTKSSERDGKRNHPKKPRNPRGGPRGRSKK